MTDSTLARRVSVVVFFAVFLDLIGFGIVIPLFPFYVESMGGSAQTVGVLLACFSAMQLIATPWLGRLSDRYGRRPVILASLAGNAASMALFAYATHIAYLPLLFASRLVAGATAGNLAACQAAIADVTDPKDRAKAMGRIGAGIGLGMILGPVLGGTLNRYGAWAPPLAAGVLAFLDLIAASILMPETRHLRAASEPAPTERIPLLTALAQPPVLRVLAIFFLIFIATVNLQVALGLLAKERFGWEVDHVGYLFGLFGVMTLIIQGGLIGKLATRFGERRLVLFGGAATAVGQTIVAFATDPALLVAGLFVMGAGIGVVQPAMVTLAAAVAAPEQRGAILGFAQSSGGLARTIGPVWSGMLFAKVAPGAPFVAGAAAALTAAALATTRSPEPSAASQS